MIAALTIVRYKKRYIPFAFFAMALFRFPLLINKKISFFKLMGSGKNGTFDKTPDLQQWAILACYPGEDLAALAVDDHLQKKLHGSFISKWWDFFNCETFTMLLKPTESHGTWDKKNVFGDLPRENYTDGPIAVITRATIRLQKLKYFWQNVAGVAGKMHHANGFITSFGIGEVPWIKQATFSVWQCKDDMKAFAYGMREHADVIKKTRKQQWYSEDMFTRFSILAHAGTIKGRDPLAGKL